MHHLFLPNEEDNRFFEKMQSDIEKILKTLSKQKILMGVFSSVLISVRLAVYALGGLVNVFFLILLIFAVVIQKEVVLYGGSLMANVIAVWPYWLLRLC